MSMQEYQRKVWTTGPRQWHWALRYAGAGVLASNLASGTATSKVKAEAAVREAIRVREAEAAANWRMVVA